MSQPHPNNSTVNGQPFITAAPPVNQEEWLNDPTAHSPYRSPLLFTGVTVGSSGELKNRVWTFRRSQKWLDISSVLWWFILVWFTSSPASRDRTVTDSESRNGIQFISIVRLGLSSSHLGFLSLFFKEFEKSNYRKCITCSTVSEDLVIVGLRSVLLCSVN